MGRKRDLEEKLVDAIKEYGPLPEYERDYVGAFPGRRLEIDFYFKEYKVGVEIQGGIWMKSSGHTGKGHLRDMEKSNLAILNGIRLSLIHI